MNRISFLENKEFLINCVAKPVIIDSSEVVELGIQLNLNTIVNTRTRSILIKEAQTKSIILSTLGISGLLKKKMVDGAESITEDVLRLINPIFKANITHFIFFLDTDDKETTAIVLYPLFNKSYEPITVSNNPDELKEWVCTNYFPIEPNIDYDIIDFNQSTTDKHYRLNIARKEDRTKEFFPVVHNLSSIEWKGNWDQRASIYDRERDLYYTLPRNYARDTYKPVGEILTHIDSIISQLYINLDYDKEFTEMLIAKLPKGGLQFMMEAPFTDHKLVTILDKIESMREELKPSVLRAIYRCLGYMIAKKIHCCPECRHLDEETL